MGLCRVPYGSNLNMVERVENQIERFALLGPSARAQHQDAADLERHNANMVGGDINGGKIIRPIDLRPTMSLQTAAPGLYRQPRLPPAACMACAAISPRDKPEGRLAQLIHRRRLPGPRITRWWRKMRCVASTKCYLCCIGECSMVTT
jgi:hypothetical protein